jgi:type I restriction enzyme, R subunit
MSDEAQGLFSAFVPDGDLAAYAAKLPDELANNFTETMKLLRDSSFQDLLLNYPRPIRSFLVALETEDQVSSVGGPRSRRQGVQA